MDVHLQAGQNVPLTLSEYRLVWFDPNHPLPLPSTAQITIDWGDGSSSQGTASQQGFLILGQHSYELPGTYTIVIHVFVSYDYEAYAIDTAVVDDTPFTATSPTDVFHATVGQSLTGTFASFHFDGPLHGGGFSATIYWDDYTQSQGTIVPDPEGGFDVLGEHVYEEPGWHNVRVTTTHDIPSGASVTSQALVLVTGNPPVISDFSVTSVPGGPTQSLTATFTSDNPALGAGDFTAMIDWGDGQKSPGTVSLLNGSFAAFAAGSPGETGAASSPQGDPSQANSVASGSPATYRVDATHTYSDPGTYTVTLSVSDPTHAASSATTSAEAAQGDESGGGGGSGGSGGTQVEANASDYATMYYSGAILYDDYKAIARQQSLAGRGFLIEGYYFLGNTQPAHGTVRLYLETWPPTTKPRFAYVGDMDPDFSGEDHFTFDMQFWSYDWPATPPMVVHYDITIISPSPPPPPPPASTSPVSISGDESVEEVSADSARGYVGVEVSSGTDADGDPIPVEDGTVVEWRVVGASGATLEEAQTTTTDGIATNTLDTTTFAGDTFHVFARVVRPGTGGNATEYRTPYVEAGEIHVVAGAPAEIDAEAGRTSLPADGTSTTTVTFNVIDAEGNPVADGTPLDVTLAGPGSLVDADDITTEDGQATVTVRAGVYAGPMTVSARADGVSGSADVDVLPLTVRLAITGNAITLGTDETATVTAAVTDSSGNPVADGTPITWLLQKGGFDSKDSQVHGGAATLVIKGKGGSQVPGNGLITASVGSTSGSTTYLWVAPAGVPFARVAHPVLAGDQRFSGSYPVEQVDGTTQSYDYYTSTSVTIASAGSPGDVVKVQVGGGPGGGSGVGALAAVGDDGQPASLVTVTVNAAGEAVFQLQSLGTIPSDRAINVPIFLIDANGNPSTTFNVALTPAEAIARTADYVGKLGYAIVAGPGSSLDEIAADVAFSLIPVVGVYSDVRDAASELLKLWPGGESPDWVSFGFAAAGILTEVLPPADLALDVAKGVARLARAGIIRPTGYVLKTTISKAKELGPRVVHAVGGGVDDVLAKLDEFFDDLYRMLPPPFGPNNLQLAGIPGLEGKPFISLVDDLAESADDVSSIQSMVARIPGMDSRLVSFTQTYGKNTAQRIAEILGKLDGPLADALAQGGKLDIVAKGMAKAGWDEAAVRNYAKQVKDLGAENLFVKQIDGLADIGPEPIPADIIRDVCANVKDGGLRGVWDSLSYLTRGDVIAYLKNQNLPHSFPAFDFWDEASGVAKSMKSLDPTLSRFVNKPENIVTDGKDYVLDVLGYKATQTLKSGRTGITYTVDVAKIQTRAVDLFVPNGMRNDPRFAAYFQQVIDFGRAKGVSVNVVEF